MTVELQDEAEMPYGHTFISELELLPAAKSMGCNLSVDQVNPDGGSRHGCMACWEFDSLIFEECGSIHIK